jgi:hypothetical protein
MSQPSTIENDTDLHLRIMKLNNLKEEQELVIKRNVKELVYSMHPSMMIKNLLNKFTGDQEAKSDLKSIGINLGKDFLITKLFGKSGSLKGFITSLFVKKATDYVINNHSETISNGIHKVEDLVKDGLHKVEDYVKELKAKVSN